MFLEDKTLNPGVKADPFSLESLIAWLERRPGETEYDFWDCARCMIAQYALDTGIRLTAGDSGSQYREILERFAANDGCRWNTTPAAEVAAHTPHTFGAALDRARALLSSSEAKAERLS